jgi:mRNA interferase MazF
VAPTTRGAAVEAQAVETQAVETQAVETQIDAQAEGLVRQYEIWWVELPDPVGRRPVLLLSRDSAYQVLTKFLVAEITTRIRGIPEEVRLGKREGLPAACVANLDNVRSVHKSGFARRAGRLGARRVDEVKRALGHALAWPELTLNQ